MHVNEHTTENATLCVAAVQMCSTPRVQENLDTAAALIERAVLRGAQWVLLPEYFCLMGHKDTDKVGIREADGEGPVQAFLSAQARAHGIVLIGGTLPLEAAQDHRVRNSVLVYGPQGQRLERYDKVHLFRYATERERYDESATIEAGDVPKAVQWQGWHVGLSVCYDLRFPELYRAVSPVDMWVVPAAFTHTTGKAHWEVLLRARAIENQCYVLACGQSGVHENNRRTFGHSMLINPWGEVEQVLPEGEGVVVGTLDRARIARVRGQLPALEHRVLCGNAANP